VPEGGSLCCHETHDLDTDPSGGFARFYFVTSLHSGLGTDGAPQRHCFSRVREGGHGVEKTPDYQEIVTICFMVIFSLKHYGLGSLLGYRYWRFPSSGDTLVTNEPHAQ